MTYEHESGEVSAIFRPDSEVDGVVRPTSRCRFVAPGSVTDGRYGLFRWEMDAGAGGATPHFHRTFSEAFYVISGRVRLYDGHDWLEAAAGDYLHVPEGGIHGFSNQHSDDPAAMLILFAPAPPRERYFIELAEIADSAREMTPEEWATFLARHDQYNLPSDDGG